MSSPKDGKPGRPKSATQMKLVAIRLHESLIDRLRVLAEQEGLPYQTYLRIGVWDHVFKEKVAIETA
jgi:predicted DNA binding CopG/RHH family protein